MWTTKTGLNGNEEEGGYARDIFIGFNQNDYLTVSAICLFGGIYLLAVVYFMVFVGVAFSMCKGLVPYRKFGTLRKKDT